MEKKLLLFILGVFATCTLSSAQPTISADSIRNSFIEQIQLLPQEKIYLHTDKSSYISGENLWFKAYLTYASAHFPSELSRFVYVELINKQGLVERRAKIRMTADESCGQIRIPETLPEDYYLLRAYTGTMYNRDEDYFFKKNIYIHNPLDKKLVASSTKADFDVAFFPEGGNLLEGTVCRVAFKAVNSTGYSANVRGFITNDKGDTIVSNFSSLHDGMGTFSFLPEKGHSYHATVFDETEKRKRIKLPQALNGAYSLTTQHNNNILKVEVNRSSDILTNEPLFLVIHTRGMVHYAELWNSSDLLQLNTVNFPSGVSQILLLDSSYKPLSERLFFCKNDDQANLSVKRAESSQPKQIALALELENLQGEFHSETVSISVTNDADVEVDATTNIMTYLLLTSDLKGYVENPAFYFTSNDNKTNAALDNLMLTQGWRRYNIPNIIRKENELLPGFVELGQSISGKVESLMLKRPITDCTVSVISLDNMYANEVKTDENGKFFFDGLEFSANTSFVLQAFSDRRKERVLLTVDEDEFPTFDPKKWHFPTTRKNLSPSAISKVEQREAFFNDIRMIQLGEVTVTGRKKESNNPFQALSDNSFDSKRIMELDATCIHELLRRIPGLVVYGNNVTIRGASSIYDNSYAAIAIDGVIVGSYNDDNDYDNGMSFDLDEINMADIERVDVFKTGSTAIWGSRGGSGVVAFTTKRGNFDLSRLDDVRHNSKRITPLGYSIPDEFYSPKYSPETVNYSNLNTTVYWNPNVQLNSDGMAKFDFPAPDYNQSYSFVIEGITSNGQIIHHVGKIIQE